MHAVCYSIIFFGDRRTEAHNPVESWNRMGLVIDGQNVQMLLLVQISILVEPSFAIARSSIMISNNGQQLKSLSRPQGQHSLCITRCTFKLIL
jgi:hypothetical protein